MIARNEYFAKLDKSYLFTEIARRVAEYKELHPDRVLYSLGIGDTTLPLPESVTGPLNVYVQGLSTLEGYRGYQNEQGSLELREKIVERFYGDTILPSEIFISDGAKCDIGRLQILLRHLSPVLIQDPTYPVYRDGTLLSGNQEIIYARCTPDNGFFPTFSGSPQLMYLCSPNNPTGMAFTYEQLKILVEYALAHDVLIVYDAAYRYFIEGDEHPRSIFEIDGADEIAIEVNSFSKFAGFTGIRLSWTVVPKKLGPLFFDFARMHASIFNGASIISQQAGIYTLDDGYPSCLENVEAYKSNAHAMKQVLEESGTRVYGGQHAPYLWVSIPGRTSWDSFDHFLQNSNLIVTPGSGFGAGGEGFVRLSGFFHPVYREEIVSKLQALIFSENTL